MKNFLLKTYPVPYIGIGHRISRARARTLVRVLATMEARRSLLCSWAFSSGERPVAPGMCSRSVPAAAATSESSLRRIRAIDFQS